MDTPCRSQRTGDSGPTRRFGPLPPALSNSNPSYGRGNRWCLNHLLVFRLRTGVDQFLDHRFRVGLVDAFLHGLGRAVHQVLRLLEAEARKFADLLDDVDLVFAESVKRHGELGLLLGCCGTAAPAARRRRHRDRRGRRGNTELVFQILDQLRQLQYRHVGNRIEDFSFCYRHFVSPESVLIPVRKRAYWTPAACCLSRTAARVRTNRAGTSFSVRANLAIGACIVPSSLASNSSREGSDANAMTSLGEITALSIAPARITSFSFALANSLSTLAVATASGEMP